jgi:hypothetical protein
MAGAGSERLTRRIGGKAGGAGCGRDSARATGLAAAVAGREGAGDGDEVAVGSRVTRAA